MRYLKQAIQLIRNLPASATIIVALLSIALVYWGVTTSIIHGLQHDLTAVSLQSDSIRAVADSTHHVAIDDTEVANRLAVQTRVQSDSIDRLLHLAPKVKYVAVLHVDTVAAVDTGSKSGDSLHFSLEQKPFHAIVDVGLNPPVAHALFSLDPAPVRIHVGCGASVNDVAPATVAIQTPEWLHVSLDSLQQDPRVCSTTIDRGGHSHLTLILSAIGSAIVGGWLVHHFSKR